MATHDYNLSDASGASFRGDLNNALAAVVSHNSNATAPVTTFAYQYWADTTAGLLKQRNAANSAWIVRGTIAETRVVARSSNTILAAGDHGKTFIATGTFTQTLTAAATLGDGWMCSYRNDGSGAVTIDPSGAETIDGATTLVLLPGQSCEIRCDGSNFKTIGLDRRFATVARSSDTVLGLADHGKTFIATGTFTQTLTAAATLGDGWMCYYRNDGSGVVTLDANASETIDGSLTKALTAGQALALMCDGSNFKTIGSVTGTVMLTPAATTSGTTKDFTIPAGSKEIVISFVGVSTSGTDGVIVQLGDSGGIEASVYSGADDTAGSLAQNSTGFRFTNSAAAATVRHGRMTLTLENASTFTWAESHAGGYSNAAVAFHGGGSKSLSAECTTVRITTTGGTDTFDAGEINVMVRG